MYSDTSGRPNAPLPPVRTRWKASSPTAGSQGRGLLGPVKSGLFAAFETIAPTTEPEPDVAAAAETEPVPEPDQPWLETPRLEEYEAAELLLEVSLDEVEDLTLLEAAGPAPIEPATDTASTEADDALPGLQAIGEPIDTAEAILSRPAPLSAWDLGARRAEADAEQARMERVREEWESLGQALMESLSSVAEAMPVNPAWSAEPAAEPEEAGLASLDGLEPVGAGFEREASAPAEETPVHGRAYHELAHRLESFAAALRTEGRYALTRAQLSGDPMDSMLAGFAAGWLAAGGE